MLVSTRARRSIIAALIGASTIAALWVPAHADAQALRLFYTRQEDSDASSGVYAINPDGTGEAAVRTGFFPNGLAVDPLGDRFFVHNVDADAIEICTFALPNSCGGAWTGGPVTGIHLDLLEDRMYFGRAINGLWRARLDGQAAESIFDGAIWDAAVDIADERLYWTTYQPNGLERVNRADFSGRVDNPILIGAPTPVVRAVAVDPLSRFAFITDSSSDRILRVSIDGTFETNAVEVIVEDLDGMDEPFGIDVDPVNQRIYFSGRQGLWSAGLDGSSVEELLFISRDAGDTGEFGPIALELDVVDIGEACASDANCITNFCADGVCCASRCDGMCQSCEGAETGMADGQCARGMAGVARDPICNDNNPCTDDFCGIGGGDDCAYFPLDAACDDGDACTLGDMCDQGICRPGTMMCDAGVDAGESVDPFRDAGPLSDAGRPASEDAGEATLDGGPETPPTDGCGCRVPRASAPGAPLALLALGLVGWRARRRR